MLTLTEFMTLAKDFVLSGAAIVGATVAIKGLNTWQRQLKGQSDYELARRLLVTLFKYRGAIDGVRNMAMWGHEMPSPPATEAITMSNDQKRFYGLSKAYKTRWDKAQHERVALHADLLEAEALWGDNTRSLFSKVFDLQHELFVRVRNHLVQMDPDTSQIEKDAVARIDERGREILYDDQTDGDVFKE